MVVRFWGVRGSIAVSGRRYAQGGGNTSCVEVEHEGKRIVFDAGTGLRALGESLGFAPVELTIFLSHYHWDHIQGVPFFMPAYNPKSRVTFMGATAEGLFGREVLARQMTAPTFPVELEALAGAEFVPHEIGSTVETGPFRVRSAPLDHPNGVVAFRVEAGGASVVYATDTEHGLQGRIDPRLIDLARDVDLLIHDAQYLREEYEGKAGPSRRGWGHSTWVEACDAARLSGARNLALFHHDPMRDDAGLTRLEAMARERFPAAFAARDEMAVELNGSSATILNSASEQPATT